MKLHFESRFAIGPEEAKRMDTAQLRKAFLIEKIFEADSICLTLTHYDRSIAGGAMPVNETPALPAPGVLKASYFLERRELGVVNVGGNGAVLVDGTEYPIDFKEALYVGKGAQEVQFTSTDAKQPAKLMLWGVL